MAQIIYDLIAPAEQIAYVRAYDNEVLVNNFTLQRWLPPRLDVELEWRIRTGTFKDVDVAEYRAFDTPARMSPRQGFSRIRGELPPLSRGIPLGEEEMLRLRALQNNNNDSTINQIYDDSERMVRSVQARLELARGELLSTGKVTLAENGAAIQVDFGLTNTPTAALTWANSSALILSELLAWTQLYVDTTGVMPGVMLMNRTVLGYMWGNAEMRAAAAFAGTTPGRLNADMVDAIFAANGLPPVELYDTKVRVDGVATNVIAADKVLFLPPAGEAIGVTEYGVTAEALKLRQKGMITQEEMPGIVAFILEQDHPVQTTTVASALAIPILGNPELILAADVVP